MAEQTIILGPGEGRTVSFKATPSKAKTYQVSVNGLTGSFVVTPIPGVFLDAVNPIDGRLYIQILNVNGIPFTSVGPEPACSFEKLQQYLENTWAQPWSTGVGAMVADSVGLANCMFTKVNPCACTTAELVEAVVSCCISHPEYVYKRDWSYEGIGMTIAAMWRPEKGNIPTAYLAEPINGLNGISLTWVNKRITRTAGEVTFRWLLGYEPQFLAPMPAPSFRGDESFTTVWPPIGQARTINIKGMYAGGYSYPGMYDGRIRVSYWTYNNPPYPIADFRIKNLAKVT